MSVVEAVAKLDGPTRREIDRGYDRENDRFKSLWLTPRTRQRLQRLKLIDRPDFEGRSFINEHDCELNAHGREVARHLAKLRKEYWGRKEQLKDAIDEYKRQHKKGDLWDDLLLHHPFLSQSTVGYSDRRLVEVYQILGGGDIVLGENPMATPSKKSSVS